MTDDYELPDLAALARWLRGRDWAQHARCAGETTVMYSLDPVDQARARELCAACPVSAQCREAGATERYGTWGGEFKSPKVRPPRQSRRRTVDAAAFVAFERWRAEQAAAAG